MRESLPEMTRRLLEDPRTKCALFLDDELRDLVNSILQTMYQMASKGEDRRLLHWCAALYLLLSDAAESVEREREACEKMIKEGFRLGDRCHEQENQRFVTDFVACLRWAQDCNPKATLSLLKVLFDE
jgi:hypothetical protein